MAKEIKVAVSPMTNVIYAGTTIKNGTAWGAGKQDVTIDALVAVAQHVLKFGAPVIISKVDGTPEFEINVTKLESVAINNQEEVTLDGQK
ncbi:hypothetical protein O8E93_003663 [Aeromonas salmonicida]|uniref:DUF7446 family protein n=1 Tax=Bacillus inaquosorum TaxID=483913 RepID=UPI003205B980|nr:hypothetical protein [Aeromonas salmonicida]